MGNEDRADDIAGKLVVDRLKKMKKEDGSGTVCALWGATVPETLSRRIREVRPSHVLIVDAVDTGISPGEIAFYGVDRIDSVPTAHTTSPALLARFLAELGADWAVIGIQPGDLTYLGPTSDAVKKASAKVAVEIKKRWMRSLMQKASSDVVQS
jgi:hydrogenase 3 maturation protease